MLYFQRQCFQAYAVPKQFWMLELRWLQGQVVAWRGSTQIGIYIVYTLLTYCHWATSAPVRELLELVECPGVYIYVHTEPRAHPQVPFTLLLESLCDLELTE